MLDFPCTWNEVPPEVVERTDALGEIAGLYGLSGVPLDSIAAFLREQPDVAAVEVLGTGVRYRLEGGGPAWVYPADELAHHRRPEGFSEDADHAGATAIPPRGVPGPEAHPPGSSPAPALRPRGALSESGVVPGLAARPGVGALTDFGRWLGPEPLLAAAPQSAGEQGVAVETPGDPKKALVLSPFEWEFPGTGAGFARRARMVRDYKEKNGGSVVYHADLDAYEENPTEPGRDQRLFDGTLLLSGEVTFEDFLHWDEYNLILLASHGTEHHCGLAPPVGGAEGPRNPNVPRVAEEWCPLIWAGRAKQESYGSYVGVEVMTHVGILYEEHPGLTRPEAEDCGRRLTERAAAREAGQELVSEELKTGGGKPCRIEAGEREKRLVGLWTPFFQEQYRNGLDNIILFLAACRSGINEMLLKHFAQDGNDHVAVFGFNDTVTGTDAFDVGNELLELLEKGYHSKEILRRLKLMDRTKHLVGRALDLGDEALPATPAEVIDAAAAPTHGRDVVLLVHPTTGEEIEDGAALRLRGASGDAKPDSLELYPQIIGVADSDPLDEMRLRVRAIGRTRPGAIYEPREEVEPGAYRHRGPVALGFDAREGEVVDLEVSGTLPGGGETRWVYEDIRLGGSLWTATVGTGRFAGSYGGWKGDVVIDHSRVGVTLVGSDERPSVLATISMDRAAFERGMPATGEMCDVEIAFCPSGNCVEDVQANRAANVCSGGDEPSTPDGTADPAYSWPYPPPATVQIRHVQDGWVEGWAEGMFFRGHPFPPDPSEQGNVRIDFRLPYCVDRFAGPC